MDVAGGTMKYVVFFQGKSRKVIVNSPIEFCDVMNKFIPLIKYLYQPEASPLEKPHNTENARVLPDTLKYIDWLERLKKMPKQRLTFLICFPVTQIQIH